VPYPESERAVVHDSYRSFITIEKVKEREAEEEGKMENGPAINLPVVLDVEILHVSDGRVDGVIEALGRWDLVV